MAGKQQETMDTTRQAPLDLAALEAARTLVALGEAAEKVRDGALAILKARHEVEQLAARHQELEDQVAALETKRDALRGNLANAEATLAEAARARGDLDAARAALAELSVRAAAETARLGAAKDQADRIEAMLVDLRAERAQLTREVQAAGA